MSWRRWLRRHDPSGRSASPEAAAVSGGVSYADLALALDLCGEAALLLDRGRRIIYANHAARNMFGIEEGQTLLGALRDHELDNLLRRSIGQGEEQAATVALSHPRRLVRAIVHPTLSGTTVMVLRDETRLHDLEQVRRDLAANVSHELRTPLATLQILVDTLLRSAQDEPAERVYFLNSVRDQTVQLSEIVEQSLELAALEAGHAARGTERVSVERLVQDAVARVASRAAAKQVHISSVVEPGLPDLHADRRLLETALVNLLDNAIKWTPRGSIVAASARAGTEGTTFEVRDQGPGLDPALLSRVFERFFTGDPARSGTGKGLGLAIAKHAVLGAGGQIWASNGPSGGACFYIALPRQEPGPEADALNSPLTDR